LLSRDFLKLVMVSLIIATPITWYGMQEWLQNYAYRIHISGWIFFLAGLIVIGFTLMIVLLQTVRAARANPVNSIRTE